jgi:hypothetical protein
MKRIILLSFLGIFCLINTANSNFYWPFFPEENNELSYNEAHPITATLGEPRPAITSIYTRFHEGIDISKVAGTYVYSIEFANLNSEIGFGREDTSHLKGSFCLY